MSSNRASKTMSNRLMGMKFMQRGALATPSTHSTPSTPETRPSKKQRLSNGSAFSTPASTPGMASEELATPDEYKNVVADNGVDTKWHLSFQQPISAKMHPPLSIVSAGYSFIDNASIAQDDSSEDEEYRGVITANGVEVMGRRNFGNFKSKDSTRPNRKDDIDSDSDSQDAESQSDGDDSDDPTGAKSLIRESRKAAADRSRTERNIKRKSDSFEADKMAAERRQKHIRLNRDLPITGGISSGGISSGGGSPRDITCHGCGRKGHMRKDCPSRGGQRK